MSNALPADAETARLAHRIAVRRGEPVETIVRDAIEAQATDDERKAYREDTVKQARAGRLARMKAIADEIAALPVLDPRTPNEIIGYGDDGLPR